MTINLNFTETDIQELQAFLEDGMKEAVFQWHVDGVTVNITVGDDEL